MKMLIVNNLASGYGNGAIYDFIRSFAKDGDEIVLRSSDGNTDLRSFLIDAKNFDMVVAVGGDTTVGTVSYLLSNTNIPILPFPAGTDNIIAENLFMPTEPHALAKLARQNLTLNFDIGEIQVGKHRYGFGFNAGAGFSTAITKGAKPRRRFWGPFAYAGAALSNFKPEPSKIKLTLDDKEIFTEGVGIMLLNFTKIGFDLSMTHKNRPRDGKLDVVVLKAKTAIDYIPTLTAAALDNAINFPDRSDAIEVYLAKNIKIETEHKMDIHTDNDITELTTPFSAKNLEGAAKYVVCEECINNYNNDYE
ncbi:MAG: diacylglycerol kinase family protein [Coriobacteriia bacterium]|nr:diacylglycerol kinase family protein [Coriobacteriia bacterium]